MTMLAHSIPQPRNPAPERHRLPARHARPSATSTSTTPANDGRISQFRDDTWHLSPAARKPTAHTSVYFGSTPEPFRDALKRLVWCAVNIDTPMDIRPPNTPPRLAAGSLPAFLRESWRPFVRWLAEQGIDSISEADADILAAYREHVVEQPISPHSKDMRMSMSGLWRMWRYAPYLPGRGPAHSAALGDQRR